MPAPSLAQTIRHHKVADVDPSAADLADAESAIEKKDFGAAEPLLQKVVLRDPSDYQAWFDLGFVYNAMGKSADSIAAYRKSVAAKPNVFESNLNLGLALAQAESPEAERYLRVATTLKPTTEKAEERSQSLARAWGSLGRALETKDPTQALEAYRQAASLQTSNSDYRISAGRLLEKQNRWSDAEAEYRAALKIDPNSGSALYALANIYLQAARYSDANEALRKIIALQPSDIPANVAARLQLGRSLSLSGNLTEAIAAVESALALEPSNLKTQRFLADLCLEAGKYPEAETRYRQLLLINPGDPELHFDLGKVFLKSRNFPAAQNEFVSAVKLKPDFGEAYGELAVAADENQNYDLAIKAADARAKFLPEIPMSYFLRATAFDHLHNYQLAAQNYHKFLAVANGRYPDQEWQSRHRLIAIEPKK